MLWRDVFSNQEYLSCGKYAGTFAATFFSRKPLCGILKQVGKKELKTENMEGLEEYQDAGDDFWNYDSSAIYDNISNQGVDENCAFILGFKGKNLNERTTTYTTPFTLEEIN